MKSVLSQAGGASQPILPEPVDRSWQSPVASRQSPVASRLVYSSTDLPQTVERNTILKKDPQRMMVDPMILIISDS